MRDRHGPVTLAALQGHAYYLPFDYERPQLVDCTRSGILKASDERRNDRAVWWLTLGIAAFAILAVVGMVTQ